MSTEAEAVADKDHEGDGVEEVGVDTEETRRLWSEYEAALAAYERRLAIGGAFTLRRLSESQVIALAAVASPESTDPVDVALNEALAEYRPDMTWSMAEPEDVDPATPTRRYSLTRVRQLRLEGGVERDLVIMRGNMRDVMAQVKLTANASAVVSSCTSSSSL